MSDERPKTCGEFGGRNRRGLPCRQLAGWGLPPELAGKSTCSMHTENPENALRDRNQLAFLAAFRGRGVITTAAEDAGVCRQRHYEWLQFDPTYPARFATAKQESIETLEEELYRRGRDGVPKRLWHDGKPVMDPDTGKQAVEYVRSDACLIFALKSLDPEKYRERHEISGTGKGGAIAVHHEHEFAERSVAELVALRDALLLGTVAEEGAIEAETAPA